MVPGHGLGRLQGLHDAGEVDETAGGVQEHLGPAHQPGLWGRDGEGDDPGDMRTCGHLALVRPWGRTRQFMSDDKLSEIVSGECSSFSIDPHDSW